MKNIKVILYLSVSLLFMACGNKATNGEAQTDNEGVNIEVDSIGIGVALHLNAPDVDTQQQAPLADFVAEQLFFSEDEEETTERPAYNGDFQGFLQACAQLKWQQLYDDTFADMDEGEDTLAPEELAAQLVDEDGETMYLSSYSIDITKAYESDDYVTWESDVEYYVYTTGGPGFAASGVTFRKADGQRIGRSLLKDTDSPTFRQLLKETVRQWAKEELEMPVDTDEELQDLIFGERKVDALPLPEAEPYLTEEGIVLPYRPMELLFVREPQRIVLPFSKVKPFLK